MIYSHGISCLNILWRGLGDGQGHQTEEGQQQCSHAHSRSSCRPCRQYKIWFCMEEQSPQSPHRPTVGVANQCDSRRVSEAQDGDEVEYYNKVTHVTQSDRPADFVDPDGPLWRCDLPDVRGPTLYDGSRVPIWEPDSAMNWFVAPKSCQQCLAIICVCMCLIMYNRLYIGHRLDVQLRQQDLPRAGVPSRAFIAKLSNTLPHVSQSVVCFVAPGLVPQGC